MVSAVAVRRVRWGRCAQLIMASPQCNATRSIMLKLDSSVAVIGVVLISVVVIMDPLVQVKKTRRIITWRHCENRT